MPAGRTKNGYFLDILERSILAVSAAMFLMQLGEELWRRFVPKYLESLGAPLIAIGLYGSLEDALDGLYQYPGGWIADRYGRRQALVLFVGLAAIGYALYATAPAWPFIFLGLAFVAAWSSMASPTLFAVVGDALPKGRRALGFTAQSILRRVPVVSMLFPAHPLILHNDADPNCPCRHAIILRIAELALGHRVTAIAEISRVDANLRLAGPVADARIHRRERRYQCGVALVQVSITRVIDARGGDEPAVR